MWCIKLKRSKNVNQGRSCSHVDWTCKSSIRNLCPSLGEASTVFAVELPDTWTGVAQWNPAETRRISVQSWFPMVPARNLFRFQGQDGLSRLGIETIFARFQSIPTRPWEISMEMKVEIAYTKNGAAWI